MVQQAAGGHREVAGKLPSLREYVLLQFHVDRAERVALPCPFSWPVRAANLKRCLLVSYVPLEVAGLLLVQQGGPEGHRVVVGVLELEVQGLHAVQPHVGGEDEAVDHIELVPGGTRPCWKPGPRGRFGSSA